MQMNRQPRSIVYSPETGEGAASQPVSSLVVPLTLSYCLHSRANDSRGQARRENGYPVPITPSQKMTE